MRGSLLYIAVFCLAWASSAPTDEPKKFHTKAFNLGENTDGIIVPRLFFKDEIVYVVCEGKDADKKCKIHGESITQGENAALSCDLNLKYTKGPLVQVALFNAGNSKSVLAVWENDKRIKLITVNLKGCHVKEDFLDAEVDNFENLFMEVSVVPHENNYDVIHRNEKVCGEFHCIATYDYEGNVVKAAASFPVRDVNNIIQIEPLDDAYLVREFIKESSSVYLIHEKDNHLHSHTLFVGAPKTGLTVSGDEQKVGFCAADDEKTVCKQYDASGKTKKFEVEITARKGEAANFAMLNLEKGLLVLVIRAYEDINDQYIQYVDEHGKEGKEVRIDLNCDKRHVAFPTMYKNSSGEYCVAFLCLNPQTTRSNHFTRNNRCFAKTELF